MKKGFNIKFGKIIIAAIMIGVLVCVNFNTGKPNVVSKKVAAATTPTNYVPKKDYSANLVANYKMDEPNGATTCIDSVHNNSTYNGTYNGTNSVTDSNGTCRSFNGTSDYISFTNPTIPVGKKSIKFKIKTNSIQNNWQPIVSNYSNINMDNGIMIYLQNNGHLCAFMRANNNYSGTYYSDIAINDNKWHTILITFNDDIKKMSCYIDNLLIPDADINYTNAITTYLHDFRIGNDYSSTCYFSGQLDDIEIYNDVVEYKGLTLDKTSLNMVSNQTETLTAKNTPDNTTNNDVTWKSSDTSIASVEAGKVTAKNLGTATITATTADGRLFATCTVTVTAAPTPTPTPTTGNATLIISMNNGQIKQYNISMDKINDFKTWYNNRASGTSGNPVYEFDKTDSSQPNVKKTESVTFTFISSFEVDQNN